MLLMLLPVAAMGQEERELKHKADSIASVFSKALDGVDFQVTQMVKNPTNYVEDLANDLTGDTIWLENYENFKFYRVKRKGNLAMAQYFTGKVGQIFEKEEIMYYFVDNKLKMTKYLYLRHGEALDDEYSIYMEDKRVIFVDNNPVPKYIYREAEGPSNQFKADEVPFRQYDVRKIIYDKYLYETVGDKIMANKTDF